jgi:hypothetical protein
MRPILKSTTRCPGQPRELSLEFGGKPYSTPVFRVIPEEEVRRRHIDQLLEIERRRKGRREKPPEGGEEEKAERTPDAPSEPPATPRSH